MQAVRLLQAAILMIVLALAASCATSKDYTSRLFGARPELQKEPEFLSVQFLELDSAVINNKDWVTTDIINGKETINNTAALDNLSLSLPATSQKSTTDTIGKIQTVKMLPEAKSTSLVNGTRIKTIRD